MGEPAATPDLGAALQLLRNGALTVEGQLIDASNATLFCDVTLGELSAACVYKPITGERPLWDFPDGTLAARETAAYLVSSQTGWDIVPPTVLRDGPFGPGMCQLWIDVDETVDLVELARSDHPGLRRMAVFDAVINNADRKGSHLLPTDDGHIFGVDHGVSFHVDDKLRTLLWRWRGDPLPADILEVLRRLHRELTETPNSHFGCELAGLISRREYAATTRRIERLLAIGRYPTPSDDWPALPWPPF